jgi:serine phosphatase RsbU (regulator of sigma subunit)
MDPGFIAVILSDGVISGKDDGWLQEMIVSFEGISPGELARTILKASSETNGQEDDMTVLAVAVSERE